MSRVIGMKSTEEIIIINDKAELINEAKNLGVQGNLAGMKEETLLKKIQEAKK